MRLSISSLAVSLAAFCASAPERDERPNFLIIVADDLGFSDPGFMGSEIRTPNLDALAAEGLVLENFHVSPTCSPTRAMLLTGTDAHPAGLGAMSGTAGTSRDGAPGYAGVLSDRVVTIATILNDAGYHTYHAGKWHLGSGEGLRPNDRGFEHTFGILNGGASHFDDHHDLFWSEGESSAAPFYRDGERVDELPADFFSSKSYTDRLIENLRDDHGDGRPFFAYAAYTAPHWPLHAPDDYIDRYRGRYDDGYDVLRARRVEALKAKRVIPADVETPPLVPWARPWHTLTSDEKAVESRRMEIFAAMVENLDFHIGRLLDSLKESGRYENTVVFFFSDNGAEGSPIHNMPDTPGWIEKTFDNRLENMGRRGSYVYTGPGWAQASTAPFRFYKTFPTEGGTRTPAIVASGGIAANGRTGAFVSVKDVAPTLLELAAVDVPRGRYRGRDVATIQGASMAPFLAATSDRVHADDYTMGWELFGRRALRRGDWKLLWLFEPYGDETWKLFDLSLDPTETNDLSETHPEELAELLAGWDAYVLENGVLLPENDTAYALDDAWR